MSLNNEREEIIGSMDSAQRYSFELSGRHIDEEVLNGRSLDEVLAEASKRDRVWFRRDLLRYFSAAVAATH